MKVSVNKKNILITGGTGSFGSKCLKVLFNSFKPNKVVVFSRDELKQYELSKIFPENKYPVRYFIGDVRDKDRLYRACSDIDFLIHATAMKRVTASEYNPTECISTNIIGAQNVIDASIYNNVKKVIALSTDKAANPINLYGATKLASDKIFIAANNITGAQKTIFSVVRYGNVAGSRGSVVPYFRELIQSKNKYLPITHEDMTRFWITLDQSVDFVLTSFERMIGGEIFVPKIPSVKIVDLAKAMAPKLKTKIVGIRPGEKIHELMCPNEYHHLTLEFKDHYKIIPSPNNDDKNKNFLVDKLGEKGKKVSSNFEYSSGKNENFLSIKDINKVNESL